MIARTRDGQRTFFEVSEFPWVAEVEAAFPAIRAELDALLARRDEIPNFQEISTDQRVLTEGADWKTFFFWAYGHEAGENTARCPATARALRGIPGMRTAMFSILAPGKHVPEHRGPWKGVLRYHLALRVPGEPGQARIRVGSESRAWVEGRSLVFDDSHPHEVWNDVPAHRAILFVDFLRPLPFPLSLVNRAVVYRISRTPFVREAIGNARIRALSGDRAAEPLA
jgi:beta-hydroxylase